MHAPHVRLAACAVLAAALLSVSASSTNAAWPSAGLPVATGPGIQRFQLLLPDNIGGAFVLWSTGERAPGGMQHVTADGNVADGWPAAGVALSPYELLAASLDGEGGLYLLYDAPRWVDYGPALAYGRRLHVWHYGADGSLAASWPDTGLVVWSEQYTLNDDYGVQFMQPQGGLPDGKGGADFIVYGERAWFLGEYHFIHVSKSGLTGHRELLVSVDNHQPLDAASDGLGSLALIRPYQQMGEEQVELLGYSFENGFTPSRVLTSGNGGAPVRVLPTLTGDELLWTWASYTEGQVRVLRTNWNFENATGWTGSVAIGSFEDIMSDRRGGLFARTPYPDGRRIQRFDCSTTPPVAMWPADQLPELGYGAMTADGLGGFFKVVTLSNEPLPGAVTRAFHYGPDGATSFAWPVEGRVLTAMLGSSNHYPLPGSAPYAVDFVSPGAAFVVWSQDVDGAPGVDTDTDVYVQRLMDDAPVPTQVSRASAEAFADRVTIEWTLSSVTSVLTVERTSSDGAWRSLGPPTGIGRDSWRFEDRDVRAGDVLRYRLTEAGVVLAGSETSANVPVAIRFALRGFTTNPTALDATVEFTLPDAQAARLELLDLAGRVLARRDVGGLGAGTHRVSMGDDLALKPGLVFARLSRAGEVKTAKATLLR